MKTKNLILHGWAIICLLLLFLAAYAWAQNTPGLNLGGTGTSSTQTAGAIPYVGSGTNALSFASITNMQFLRSGGTGAPTGLDLFGTANTWSAAQALNGGLSSTGTANFTGGILRVPNSNTLPATCTSGDLYQDNDATSGQRFCNCEATNTWKCSSAAAPTNAQLLVSDELYNGSTGAVFVAGNATKYGVFGVRYNMTNNYTEGFAYPAGAFSNFSAVVTPGSATCTYTVALEKDTGGGYSSCLTLSGMSGTSRTQAFSASSCTVSAGDKVRIAWTPSGAGCSGSTGTAPVSQALFVAS